VRKGALISVAGEAAAGWLLLLLPLLPPALPPALH
jgi:hypothetical protein